MRLNSLKQISFLCELHDNAQVRTSLIVEGFFEGYNIGTSLGSQYSNLVEGIVSIFLFDFGYFDLNNVRVTLFMA